MQRNRVVRHGGRSTNGLLSLVSSDCSVFSPPGRARAARLLGVDRSRVTDYPACTRRELRPSVSRRCMALLVDIGDAAVVAWHRAAENGADSIGRLRAARPYLKAESKAREYLNAALALPSGGLAGDPASHGRVVPLTVMPRFPTEKEQVHIGAIARGDEDVARRRALIENGPAELILTEAKASALCAWPTHFTDVTRGYTPIAGEDGSPMRVVVVY